MTAGDTAINTISILGSGWLGLPLAQRFVAQGYGVKTSTTSASRLQTLSSLCTESFLVDIGKPLINIQSFLKSTVLVVNITSKDIDGFKALVQEIETSEVRKVLFVSSTSVYPVDSKTVTEADAKESPDHPLTIIEKLFVESAKFDSTILRFAGLIGYSRHPGRFFRGGKTARNPDANINLIHRDDCINIIDGIVTNNLWGETFNGCADTHPSKREFYSQAATQLGAPPPAFEESDDRSFKIISNEKIRRRLNYDFVYPDLMAIPSAAYT
jgi:nucleoside-diphosphate-sugar epimerase